MRKIEFQDAFTVARIIKKADLKEEFAAAFKKGSEKGASAKDIGIDVLFAVVQAAGAEGLDKEVFEFLGSVTELGAETIKHQSMKETIEQFKQIAKENDLEDFFKSVQALMK